LTIIDEEARRRAGPVKAMSQRRWRSVDEAAQRTTRGRGR